MSVTSPEVSPDVEFRALLRHVVGFTLAFEVVGAAILTVLWLPRFGGDAVWHAFFHSVSAFCNAGFSTFTSSLMGFQTSPLTLSVIMGLVILGGLGFLTLEELGLALRARGRRRQVRVSLHSRLALATTALLIGGGWIFLTMFEWQQTLAGLPLVDRLTNGLFLSVTARTAGFNSIDYATASDATNFSTILLMSIGGSPGSTAGGMKTTTVALLGLLALARLRGDRVVSAAGRSIPEDTVQRAVGLFTFGLGLVTVGILAMVALQGESAPGGPAFLSHMFEAVSAFNTVGLSMGATPELGTPSKLLAILLMYIGRVGSLTFATAIALRRTPHAGGFRHAYEDVVIG